MAEITQMIIVPIRTTISLDDTSSSGGIAWLQALELVKSQPGFQRLYWGRRHEIPEHTQLHIGISVAFSYKPFHSSSMHLSVY